MKEKKKTWKEIDFFPPYIEKTTGATDLYQALQRNN